MLELSRGIFSGMAFPVGSKGAILISLCHICSHFTAWKTEAPGKASRYLRIIKEIYSVLELNLCSP